ncbi:MAG: hypothetical protein HC873_15650 [Leptolyngbyaceae cyanobacterium SL_1_1]|nr:hypothetical protein [Leptolyngbyaceae cyanobacterium SL_1_1]
MHTFKRREILPLEANLLWQIHSGAVRLLTLQRMALRSPWAFGEVAI